eukprot:4504296-Amphidinium_carterae.1
MGGTSGRSTQEALCPPSRLILKGQHRIKAKDITSPPSSVFFRILHFITLANGVVLCFLATIMVMWGSTELLLSCP